MLFGVHAKMLGRGQPEGVNMQHVVQKRATIRVADRTDVSGRVTADEVNLDRFHNCLGKVCGLVAARSKVYLSAATMILIVTLAVPASAQKQVSFSGAIQGLEIDTPTGTNTLSVQGSTTGMATHLGQFQLIYHLMVNTMTGQGTGGTANLFNANGDSISMTFFGQLTPKTPPFPPVVGSITGRFAGAQGGFTVERFANLVGPPFTGGVIHDGTITLPNAQNDNAQ
jgi:hypothetical protein